jgi:uncharacterized membrane protein YccC
VAGLQNLPGELAAFREEVNARFDRADARLDAIERRITDENERLYARMLLLHEDLVARIALIGEHPRRPKR